VTKKPSGSVTISTFPKILDSPDVLEIFTQIWVEDVMTGLNANQKKSVELLMQKSKDYIHKMYPLFYSDEFAWSLNNATSSVRGDKKKYEVRKNMIISALRFGTKNARNLQAIEDMTAFKPFNIREIEFDVWD
jgi:hypothetical protein